MALLLILRVWSYGVSRVIGINFFVKGRDDAVAVNKEKEAQRKARRQKRSEVE
jgi:hypothetical protein